MSLNHPYELIPLPGQPNTYVNPSKVSYMKWFPELNRTGVWFDNGDNEIVQGVHPTQLMYGFATGDYDVAPGTPLPSLDEPEGPTPLERALRDLAIQTLVNEGYTVTPPTGDGDLATA